MGSAIELYYKSRGKCFLLLLEGCSLLWSGDGVIWILVPGNGTGLPCDQTQK